MYNSFKNDFVFATYASDTEQVKKANMLIKSIRENGGNYRGCKIHVGIDISASLEFYILKQDNVILINVNIPRTARNYPYSVKAYAAAEIEKSLNAEIKTMAWFDPETVVLGPPNELELNQGYSAAIRPVFIWNKIGLLPDEEPNDYWGPVYKYLNINPCSLPIVETEVDLVKTRAYYNCGIFSVDPSFGILQKWANVQTIFLRDCEYQKNACSGTLKKIFFHQMIFSCVVSSMLKPNLISPLPISCGYPLELNSRIPEEKKIYCMNDISCAITEHAWENPDWMMDFTVQEPLKSWLEKVNIL